MKLFLYGALRDMRSLRLRLSRLCIHQGATRRAPSRGLPFAHPARVCNRDYCRQWRCRRRRRSGHRHHERWHEAAASQFPVQTTGSRTGGRSTKRTEEEMLREHEDGPDTFPRAFIACMDARWQLQPLCCSRPVFTDQSLCRPSFFFISGANSPMPLMTTPTQACVMAF